MKAILIYFLRLREFEVVFALNLKKKSVFLVHICEIVICGMTSLTDFYAQVCFLLKKLHVSGCQNKKSFLFKYAPEIHIFNFWQHQTLLSVANQLQDSTFSFEINSEDIW